MNPKQNSKIRTSLTKNQLAKQKCVEKISNFLIKKYGNLFKDKSYSNKQLIEDISSHMKDKDVQSFNFSTSIIKYEKLILEKVSKYESKQSLGLEMNQIKDLLPKKKIEEPQPSIRQKSTPHSKAVPSNTIQEPQGKITPEDNAAPYGKGKMDRLRRKENDEWAIKSKKEHEMYLIEEQAKKKSIEDGKRKQKEMLEMQIKEKEMQKEKEKKEEYDLYIKNNNYNQHFGNEDNFRLNQMRVQQSNNIHNKSKLKTEEQLNDNKYYEQLKKDIINEENIEKEKKKKQRELNMQIQRDNEANSKMKRQLMEQEKEQQREFISKVKDPFTENNNENSNDIFNKPQSRQQGRQVQITETPLQKKEKCIQAYEENKLQREMREREALEKQREEDKNNQKKMMMEQFKQGLNAQVNEKKRIQKERETNKQQELVDSNKMNELYNKDIKKNNQDKMDKINKYRHQLDMQINTNQIDE